VNDPRHGGGARGCQADAWPLVALSPSGRAQIHSAVVPLLSGAGVAPARRVPMRRARAVRIVGSLGRQTVSPMTSAVANMRAWPSYLGQLSTQFENIHAHLYVGASSTQTIRANSSPLEAARVCRSGEGGESARNRSPRNVVTLIQVLSYLSPGRAVLKPEGERERERFRVPSGERGV
jgi:hypothetical protein